MEKLEILDRLASIKKKQKLSKKDKLALQAAIIKYKKATTWDQVIKAAKILGKLLI